MLYRNILLLILLLSQSVRAADVLIVVEEALYSRLTELAAYTTRLGVDGWTVEVLRYDSRQSASVMNLSSSAAQALASTNIWPKITNGLTHVNFFGELPVFVSGFNACPDGHNGTFTPGDGWRDSQNSAGAYKAMEVYGAPGTYTDIQDAPQSMVVQRNNESGDGRKDQDNFPGAKIQCAVGWVGGFGDLALDATGLDRRALVLNSYFARNVAYREHAWSLVGAAYEFTTNSVDPHADVNWYNDAVAMFGAGDVTANAISVLGSGADVTNRTTGFFLAYTGSDWFPNLTDNLGAPFAAIEFHLLSYHFECPVNNNLSQALKDSPDYGPLVCIPWYGTTQGLDITLLGTGSTIGEMIIAASLADPVTPITVGCMGDVTLRTTGAGGGANFRNIRAQKVRGIMATAGGD